MAQVYEKLIKMAIKEGVFSEEDLKAWKRRMAAKFGIDTPKSEDLRNAYRRLLQTKKIKRDNSLEKILVMKKVRTLSGVAVVAVLTKDYPCQNNCLYCPSEPKMPKSYLSNEPAVMRAIGSKFDPYVQVTKRLEALSYNGHDVSKTELIVMGGTFSHLPLKYQYWFIKECYRAANDWQGSEGNGSVTALRNSKSFKNESLAEIKKVLKQEKKKNWDAAVRIVGLTLETRPDKISLPELKKYRELGCTRVEIGVQSINDAILKKNRRGHGVATIKRATKLLKELGFKINYHMMPGLWGSDLIKDAEMFRRLFKEEAFQPDMLKIYPCVVTKEAELYQLFLEGKYQPYTNEELKDLIIEIKKNIPEYVRIARLIRDIPTVSIVAGPNVPNLRGILQEVGVECKCIRCREVGRRKVEQRKEKESLDCISYKASGGKEFFLQIVSGRKKDLHAFLRLRIPAFELENKPAPVKELEGAALIREIHSYGQVVPVGEKVAGSSQHKGWGKLLVKEAEKIVQKEGLKKIAVIAAEGTKRYYEALGFQDEGLYMTKDLYDL